MQYSSILKLLMLKRFKFFNWYCSILLLWPWVFWDFVYFGTLGILGLGFLGLDILGMEPLVEFVAI